MCKVSGAQASVMSRPDVVKELTSNLLPSEEAAYDSFYTPVDYPITKVLREPVYVEVRITERSDPNLVLNLEHCWATATSNPGSLPQWDLLVDGYMELETVRMTAKNGLATKSDIVWPFLSTGVPTTMTIT